MTADIVMDILREAVWAMIRIGAPAMIVAMLVGLVISLLQAVTQIQEPTLAFVPKLLAIFATCAIAMPFMLSVLEVFTRAQFAHIASFGAP